MSNNWFNILHDQGFLLKPLSLVKQPQLTSEYSQKADRLHEGGILHQKEHEHGA